MDLSEKVLRVKPAGMAAEEWAVRLELAALYRLFDWMGWTELIYNHITAKVPILCNHGLLVACPGIPEAFTTYWTLQRACEIQSATDAMAGENLPITQKVLDETPARTAPFRKGPRPGGMAFDGTLRRAGIRYEDLV